ncbi:MAG: hypothetical protein RLY87_1214, partial [Chloroflexota bacterium]
MRQRRKKGTLVGVRVDKAPYSRAPMVTTFPEFNTIAVFAYPAENPMM